MIDPNKYEMLLILQKQELERRLHQIEAYLRQPADPDAEERATERGNDEVLESLGTAATDELRAIEAALARIAEGRFGICASCGGWISEERLDALPFSSLCSMCAADPRSRKRLPV